MALIISPKVRQKLKEKHAVSEDEILQCFANRDGVFLMDTRDDHVSDPPTQWFISETYMGRRLKVVFIPKGDDIIIRTSYEPNPTEESIYRKHG